MNRVFSNMKIMVLHAYSWRSAIIFSLAFNLLLFTLPAVYTRKGNESEQVEYVPVEMIQLAGEEKPEPLRPSAAALVPSAEQQPVETSPQPIVEKELGMDKTGQEPVPPVPQQPQTVYQPFHKVTRMPYFKSQVKPVYPSSERAAGTEARVVAEVYINVYGGVDEVRIIKSGGKSFDDAVIRATQASSFTPGYLDGKQVAVKVQIPFVFKLR